MPISSGRYASIKSSVATSIRDSVRAAAEWILLAGQWADSGVWKDSETWNDGV